MEMKYLMIIVFTLQYVGQILSDMSNGKFDVVLSVAVARQLAKFVEQNMKTCYELLHCDKQKK